MYAQVTANPDKHRANFKVVYPTPEKNRTRSYEYSMKQSSPGSSVLHSKFNLFGVESSEVFHVLDSIDGYILVIYTGKGFGGEYQHAVVYSQEPSNYIPVEIEERFDTLLEDAGLYEYLPSFSEFKGVSYDDPICEEFLPVTV